MTEIQNPTTKQFGNLQPNVAEYTFSTACQSNSKISNNTPNGINTDVFRKVFNSNFGNSDPQMISSLGVNNDDEVVYPRDRQHSDALSLQCLRQPAEIKDNLSSMLTGRSCESLWNKITISNDMTQDELKIHNLLDSMNMDQLNIGQYLDSLHQIESPDVKKQFIQQPIKLNLKERREMKYSNMAKSECGESPFSRPSNITRHSVKGNRPYFSLLKQPITCNNTGGKTARNSEPVQDDQLFHFSKAGNESSNRMKLLEMRMHQSEFQKNSPYSYSEPRPSDDVEMTSQVSSDNEDNSLRNVPKCLFQQPREPMQKNFSSPVKSIQDKIHVNTGVTPIKKLQDMMNTNNKLDSNFTGGSEDYNIISPSIKKINQQSDHKKMSKFSIQKKLKPIKMETASEQEQPPTSMAKSQSLRQDRIQNPISNLNFKMPHFGESENDMQLRNNYVDKDAEMKPEDGDHDQDKDQFAKSKESFGVFSPGISSGTEMRILNDENEFEIHKFNSFQDYDGPLMKKIMLKQKSGNFTQSTKTNSGGLGMEAVEALKGGSTASNNERLSSNRPTGLNLRQNNYDVDFRKSSELTPSNPFQFLPADSAQEQHTSEFFKGDLLTPEEQSIRKQSFEGQQDTPLPKRVNMTDNSGTNQTVLTNIFKRGLSFKKDNANEDVFQYIQGSITDNK